MTCHINSSKCLSGNTRLSFQPLSEVYTIKEWFWDPLLTLEKWYSTSMLFTSWVKESWLGANLSLKWRSSLSLVLYTASQWTTSHIFCVGLGMLIPALVFFFFWSCFVPCSCFPQLCFGLISHCLLSWLVLPFQVFFPKPSP